MSIRSLVLGLCGALALTTSAQADLNAEAVAVPAANTRAANFEKLHGAEMSGATSYALVKVAKGDFEAARRVIFGGGGQVLLSTTEASGFLGLGTTHVLLVQANAATQSKLTEAYWAEPVTKMSGQIVYRSHENQWASSRIIQSTITVPNFPVDQAINIIQRAEGNAWGFLSQDHRELYDRHFTQGSAWGPSARSTFWVEVSSGRQTLYDRNIQ